MPDLRGVDYLRSKLSARRTRVLERYQMYEMKNQMIDFNISTPSTLKYINYTLGWCAKAVDSLADRIVVKGFDNDIFNLQALYNFNNPDVIFDSAILAALIASCSFLYIAPSDNGPPRMRIIDAYNATGVMDPMTGMLTEGYAVLERRNWDNDPSEGAPAIEAYFTSDYTQIIEGDYITTYDNPAGYPLLVPIVHRPDAKREFGHSRITKACESLVNSALRTVKRSEISAEFYSFPQRYAVGMSEDAELDKWKAAISYFLVISKDRDGDKPDLGQFQQQSMQPHFDQLRAIASLFAGETGLTLDDLGFATENPASAEAIKASHENLRLAARKAQRTLSTGLVNAGFLARCVADNYAYDRWQVANTHVAYEPIFEPDAAMLTNIGDGAIKINQAVPSFFTRASLENLTGIKAGNEDE